LPALKPTYTVLRASEGKSSASPDRCIQYVRNWQSPPPTSNASVSSSKATQISRLMLGNAVSSSSPSDFQPSSQKGSPNDPQMTLRTMSPPRGKPYMAVGTKRALASEIGLPRSLISASRILVLLMQAEVRRSFIICFSSYSKVTIGFP